MNRVVPLSQPQHKDDTWMLAGKRYRSRLLVGTGKYRSMSDAVAAIEASGAEIITVAVRRIDWRSEAPMLQEALPPERYTYLPNSAGCHTADEAVRVLNLAREASGHGLVKLEVIGDPATLYPHMEATVRATEQLAKDGFQVMAYTNDDPEWVKRVEDAGAVAVMPLAAPIGSGLGIRQPEHIKIIVAQSRVPVLVDAGIGTASDAALAMELGCDGVLMNSAIAKAQHPVTMARAMKLAVESGRLAYYAGRMPKQPVADASSPNEGRIE